MAAIVLQHPPRNLEDIAAGERPPMIGQAQITRTPNFTQYLERAKRQFQTGNLPEEVPHGWPTYISGAQTWNGDEIDEEAYVLQIGKADIEELAAATNKFKNACLSYEDLTKDTFPLPNLGLRLSGLSDSLFQDRGFFVLRGLDSDHYTPEDWIIVSVGMCRYMCTEFGSQGDWDGKRHMLTHILNTPSAPEAEQFRPATSTPEALSFHTDASCDVIALAVVGSAASGGSGFLASMNAVYNELAATRPDLIHTLSNPDWPYQDFGPKTSIYRRALLYLPSPNRPIFNLSRAMLLPRQASTKPTHGLSEAQAEALDAVHFIAEKHALRLVYQPGDLCFVNNLALLHARGAFRDGAHARGKRHLLRLWLQREPCPWVRPRELDGAWKKTFTGAPGQEETWDLKPLFLPTYLVDQFSSSNH